MQKILKEAIKNLFILQHFFKPRYAFASQSAGNLLYLETKINLSLHFFSQNPKNNVVVVVVVVVWKAAINVYLLLSKPSLGLITITKF